MTDVNGAHQDAEPERIPIGVAARLTGVSTNTLRRWEREGRLTSERTPGGQRRYLTSDIKGLLTS